MHDHDHDHGLAHDLKHFNALMQRRRALWWLAGAGAAPLLACGGGGDDATAAGSTSGAGSGSGSGSGGSAGTSTCSVIPEETAGPFPGDGSNSANGAIANALALSGIVRSDIRSSIAGASGVAGGVPLTLRLTLVNTNSACADLSGYAVYVWHCDREGRYSMYTSGVTAENYLRGVQATDANGVVSFTTVFPGCYAGRMPHIHFEVYRSLATATAATSKIKTSQLAFPMATSQAVYATTGYSASVNNLAQISFATDMVFSDGTSLQMATMAGDTGSGYVATLQVGIAA